MMAVWGQLGLTASMGLTLVGLAAWVALHRPALTGRAARAAGLAARVLVGWAVLSAGLAAGARWLTLASPWPWWLIALLGAGAFEAIVELYRQQRQAVPRARGRMMLALRLVLAGAMVFMLAQPVRVTQRRDTFARRVAVLVDESASMRIADIQLTAAERLRLGEALGAVPPRLYAMERTAYGLGDLSARLTAQADWVASVTPENWHVLDDGRKDRVAALEALAGQVDQRAQEIEKVVVGKVRLEEGTRNALRDLRAALATKVAQPISQAAGALAQTQAGDWAGQARPRVIEPIRRAAAELGSMQARLAQVAQAVDRAAYEQLAEPARTAVDELARQTRLALAQRLMQGPRGEAGGLLDELGAGYDVRLYGFAGDVAAVEPSQWRPATQPTSRPAGDDPARQTDLAGALAKAMADTPGDLLAGVVILSDGRHNAAGRVEPLARRLGAQGTPICPIVLGSRQGPRDAAVLAVDVPETVYIKDKVSATAHIRLEGLAGQDVKVRFVGNQKILQEQTVRATAASWRTSVEFSDTPEQRGLAEYRVEIVPIDGEAFEANNSLAASVNVTDDRTRMLLVDGRPRWEYRYLKNLFADRDRTVQLQHVLLEPDRIESLAARASVRASVSTDRPSPEATDLPAGQEEWMKFDVIVLGDVAPTRLGLDTMKTLHKFVTERAGTLIVVAGPWHMPHSYGYTPVQDLLPVTFDPAERFIASPDSGFSLALTSAGKTDPMLRLGDAGGADGKAVGWDDLPSLYWRHPVTGVKPGATVLAYAVPLGAGTAATGEEEDFHRRQALLAVQNVGLGKVMFVGFDQTWRLRYRVGDTYHHRFWGQVVRWATSGKLPAGTDLARLGCDRSRYAAEDPVRVHARLLQSDRSPLVSDEVFVNVLDVQGKAVVRRKLHYQEGSAGMYAGEIGKLAGGRYRVELDGPAVRSVLAGQNATTVATEFTVAAAATQELIELSPDVGLLGRLAELSGGRLLEPVEALGAIRPRLGEATLQRRERRQYLIWNSWWLLAVMLLSAGGEWILRKKAGLT